MSLPRWTHSRSGSPSKRRKSHPLHKRKRSISRNYFGTDGIRGTVGQAPITPDFMLRLGHAVGRVLRKSAKRPTVLIGKDTRISGYMIESALEAGFASAGVNVLLTGPLPTPGVAYLTRALRQDLGVVISASHNPFAGSEVYSLKEICEIIGNVVSKRPVFEFKTNNAANLIADITKMEKKLITPKFNFREGIKKMLE